MFLYIPLNISSKELKVAKSYNLPNFPLYHTTLKTTFSHQLLLVGMTCVNHESSPFCKT